MRKAVLLYNPESGARQSRRLVEVQSALAILQKAGVEAALVLTESTDHAGEHAARAIQAGCDTVFACGGDGTIHNIIQVLAQTPVALGILPMGTGNTLAHDLRLPLKVAAAATTALHAQPRRIALGRVHYRGFDGMRAARYFVIAAGIGVDAHLFYKLHHSVKQKLGMSAYYLKAWHLWWTHPMTRFRAEYVESGSNEVHRADVTELMGVRIRYFGGVLRELAPGASLDRDDVRIVICQTSSRLAYLLYVMRGVFGVRWQIPGVDLAFSQKVSCDYASPAVASEDAGKRQPSIYVEADGELLGTLPVEITVVPEALTLLTPS
ncbi:MAG TPA: diacylglycerol kinase family protein [Candidatus Sulfotelmatobacter sp.]